MKPVEVQIQGALLKATEPLVKRHVRRQAKLVRLMIRMAIRELTFDAHRKWLIDAAAVGPKRRWRKRARNP